MKRSVVSLVLLCTSIILTGCHPRHLIYNVDHHPMPSHVEHMSQETIKNTIVQTAARRGWICHQAGYGKLVCHLKRRAHQATIEISYNRHEFSIHHVNSNKLKLKEDLIHPKYNKWIKLLEKEIVDALNEQGVPH